MKVKKLKFEEIEKNQDIFKKEQFSYKVNEHYREYQNLYFKTNFDNQSFEIGKQNKIIVPLTFDKSNNNYSFFRDPIEFFCSKKIGEKDYSELKKKIDELKFEKLFKIEIKNEIPFINNKFNFIDRVIKEIYIDLSLSLENIKSNFSSNLRNEIKKEYSNTTFEIIDYKNYKKDMIYEMMELHKLVAGRQTRSKDSWQQNEKMILKNRGFLTRVTVDQKVISYSFFYHNEYTCMYLSSVGLREYYKIVRNVHHKSLALAINQAKINCKYFFVGHVTLFDKIPISDKEKNIEKFKAKFKGINKNFVIINKLPEYELYSKLIEGNHD